jgi:hypothetical protein
MTLIVLGIDALDAGLVEEWDIEELKLEQHKEIESLSSDWDRPHTIEVWPSVATGLTPDEHGIKRETASDWSYIPNYFHRIASKLLTYKVRMKIGSLLEYFGDDYELPEVDEDTFMDGENRTVHNWPSVSNNEELKEMWRIFQMDGSEINKLEMKVFGKGAEQFGWAREMLNHNLELAAVHIHTLDVLGHSYTLNKQDVDSDIVNVKGGKYKESEGNIDNLREAYERVGDFVDEIVDSMGDNDELLIISDHGMKNSLLDNSDFGSHSYRAYAATTVDCELPSSVLDYKGWIEDNVSDIESDSNEKIDMPTEQLKDLGYID